MGRCRPRPLLLHEVRAGLHELLVGRPLLEHALHQFNLLATLQTDEDAHPRPLDWDDLLELLENFERLLLRSLLLVDSDLAFTHGLQYYVQRKSTQVRCVDRHLDNQMGCLLLKVVKLPLSLLRTELELAFVEDFHEDLVLRQLVAEDLEILLASNLALRSVGEYRLDLDDLVDIGFLTSSPTGHLVLVARQLKLLAAFLQFDHGDVREQFDALW